MRAAQQVLIDALRADFDVCCRHFGLSAESRRVAWESCVARPERAGRCYRAIAHSLAVKEGPAKSETRRRRR